MWNKLLIWVGLRLDPVEVARAVRVISWKSNYCARCGYMPAACTCEEVHEGQ